MPPIACSSVVMVMPCCSATCWSTRTAIRVTSGPIPSPGSSVTLSVLVISCKAFDPSVSLRTRYSRFYEQCRKFLADDLGQVRVLDRFHPVGKRHEPLVDCVQVALRELEPELLATCAERVPSGMFAEHQRVGRHSDRLRRHDLIRQRVLQHAVLVNAGL